jgi:hypothetical protein
MEENLHCYTFELHKFSKGLLDASVDTTYVINLRNNGRYESILKEVTDYKPTSLVYIVLNDGYKKCKKVFEQKTPKSGSLVSFDLMDANLQIYKHAEQMKYKNILILEDDCFFSKDIRDKKVLNDLNTFLIDHSLTAFSYRLGCIPRFMLPFLTHVPYSDSGGTHAYIVSRSYRDSILQIDQAKLLHIDNTVINNYKTQYIYYKPLAYQLFPITESMDTWFINNENMDYIIPYMREFCMFLINLLGIDKRAEPGYTILYTIVKIFSSLLILIVLFLVYKGVQWIPFLLKGVQPLRKLKGQKSK